MRLLPKPHLKLPKLSQIVHKLFKKRHKPQKSETQEEIRAEESTKDLLELQPEPPKSEKEETPLQTSSAPDNSTTVEETPSQTSSAPDDSTTVEETPSQTSSAPDDSTTVGTIDELTDSPGTFLDPLFSAVLDTGNLEPLVEDPCNNDKLPADTYTAVDEDSDFALSSLYQEHDGDPQAADDDIDGSLSSLNHDVSTITIDKPLPKTPEPDVHDVEEMNSSDPSPRDGGARTCVGPLQTPLEYSSLFLFIAYRQRLSFVNPNNARTDISKYLTSESPTMDLGTWSKEALEEYKFNPGLDTPFREFVHRQRVVEWRRYRVRQESAAAPRQGEYLVIKIQDATETRFLYLERLLEPMNVDLWETYDGNWLKNVKDEGRYEPGIDTHVTVRRRKGPPESRDLRLIWGDSTPCDHVKMLQNWPRNDVEQRETHIYEPDDQPDLLDLFIAARMVHLDTSFSMFRRQDHWFTKVLSRVLNQKWDKHDQFSVADKNKFDQKRDLQGLLKKWDRLPVTDLRHNEVLKLREHCNNWREKLLFVTKNQEQRAEVWQNQDETNLDKSQDSRVKWAETDEIHILEQDGPNAGSPTVTTAASASKLSPSKSILKPKSSDVVWPELQDSMIRGSKDSKYLISSVKTIVEATDVTEPLLLVKAYNNITQYLREPTTEYSPLSEIQEYRSAFVKAVVRDLTTKVLGQEKEESAPVVPSPTSIPVEKKKQDGMSDEQAKHARDKSAMTHAIIRLLSFIFRQPFVMNIFNDIQLQSMLEVVLAILRKDNLPALFARKTQALAILLIQTQRLSAAVLAPFIDHISLALYRGINHELGRASSVGDALRAVHDLSIHLPSIFIPSFTRLVLPSVLVLLLSSTLDLRVYASYALSGFVAGATSIPNAPIHAKISNIVLKYITTPSPYPISPEALPIKPSSSPAHQTPIKPEEPLILWVLRVLLQVNTFTHPALGPVWAIYVLSALIVLLGPAAMHVPDLRVLVQLGIRHENSSVSALMAAMWRCVIWVYVCPPLITADKDGKEEVDEREMEREAELRDEWWKVMASVVEMGTGACAIVATLGSRNAGVPVYDPSQWVDPRLSAEERKEQPLRRALEVLCAMAGKDATTRQSAIDTMRALVGADIPLSKRDNVEARENEKVCELVPRELFSMMPGLPTTLDKVMQTLFELRPKGQDVRMLTQAEMGKMWVWEGIVKAWKVAVGASNGDEWQMKKKELLKIWEGIYFMGLKAAIRRKVNPDETIDELVHLVKEFVDRTTNVIVAHVLENADLDLRPSSPPSQGALTRTVYRRLDIPGSIAKLGLARDMWRSIRLLTCENLYGSGREHLAQCLMRNVEKYTTFGNPASKAARNVLEDEKKMNEAWVEFCVDVLGGCGSEVLWSFWYGEDGKCAAGWGPSEKALIWRVFAPAWRVSTREWLLSSDRKWMGAVWTLVVPFCERESWTLTSNDANEWEMLLNFAITEASHRKHDSNSILNMVVKLVAEDLVPGYIPVHMKLVVCMLNHLVMNTANWELELPGILDFVATTMSAAYPPPEDQTAYISVIRAMTSLIHRCPRALLTELGKTTSRALVVWFTDPDNKWDQNVVEDYIDPLYKRLFDTIQDQPTIPVLSAFGPALCARRVLRAPLEQETPAGRDRSSSTRTLRPSASFELAHAPNMTKRFVRRSKSEPSLCAFVP